MYLRLHIRATLRCMDTTTLITLLTLGTLALGLYCTHARRRAYIYEDRLRRHVTTWYPAEERA